MKSLLALVLSSGLAAGSSLPVAAQDAAVESDACAYPATAQLQDAAVPDGFCAWRWADGVGVPRGITVDDNGDVLVVTRADGSVLLLHDDDGDGVSGEGERVRLTSAPGLNHGLAIDGGYLYASNAGNVFRWSYPGDRAPLGEADVVITGIPSGGFHQTRTLVVDDGFLYVSVGSATNVDDDPSRARIVRFETAELVDGSVDFADGEVFADGLRNEVGLAIDQVGRLWGVENGRDELRRADFDPSDIHEDNPAEELNLFAEPGRFYGYPYCWSEFRLPEAQAQGPGTQWADPRFLEDGTHTDAWCRNTDNVVPPVLSMQAHAAPLDLLFYPGGSFPHDFTGDALVTYHGSWNRSEPTGYKVVRIPFAADVMPAGEPQPLLEYAGTGDLGAGWPHRPVGLAVLPGGRLLISSDNSDSILAVDYAA